LVQYHQPRCTWSLNAPYRKLYCLVNNSRVVSAVRSNNPDVARTRNDRKGES
jgi:hypothetical protein